MAADFPKKPADLDWPNIGFRVREVNGHIESRYSARNGHWTEPKWVKDPMLRLHGMAPALNYGMQCYEGLKAFRAPGDTKINLFRPNKNAERMQHSASYVSIPAVPTDLFIRCCKLAVGINVEYVPPHASGAAMYVRPLLIGSSAQLGLNPPEEYTFLVFVLPTGVYHGTAPVKALIVEDFDRAAPEGTGSAKVGGNYAPVLRHSEKAYRDGYGITLHLDSRTRSEIDEFSTSGFIGVRNERDSRTLVVPDSKNVINSVTVDSVCEIAKSLGWKVESTSIKISDLSGFSEVFAAGTAAALVPVQSITFRSTGCVYQYLPANARTPGPVCEKLLSTLQGIQRGEIQDDFGWLYAVDEPKNLNDQEAANIQDTNANVLGAL